MNKTPSMKLISAATKRELLAVYSQEISDDDFSESLVCIKNDCIFAVTGIGVARTVLSLSLLIREYAIVQMIQVGIAGAYPGGTIAVGDVVVVASDVIGDLGAETDEGFKSLNELGIGDDKSYYGDVRLISLFEKYGVECVAGVTVNNCTGTEHTGLMRKEKYSGVIESMEGAGFYMVANEYGIPAVQVRAISNVASTRDKSQWNILGALSALKAIMNGVEV